ncbi:MAG TPA: Uma2 family endonuclease [Stellaceae bacterium]|nr:Uma2 family endonuclease [Stellaceae bacterium]
MSALPKFAPSRMTVAEFLDWPGDETGRAFELVDGEPQAMAPASGTHGTMQVTIGSILRAHLRSNRSGCRVAAEPGIVPHMYGSVNVRIPNLAVTCAPNEATERALPDPLLIIEILSPNNEAETRQNVWAYASIPSVMEILLVRSTRISAELLRREADGMWPKQPELIEHPSELCLESIGYRGPLADFYEDTHLRRAERG